MRNTKLLWMVAATLVHGCSETLREAYKEPVIESVTDNAGSRPNWLKRLPGSDGRIYYVTSFSDGLNLETSLRVAKAYALAQISEQLQASVSINSQLNTHRSNIQIQDKISWQSAAIVKSLRQDDFYWERRWTQEGTRYSVWVLWSMPEKTFYTLQEEISK